MAPLRVLGPSSCNHWASQLGTWSKMSGSHSNGNWGHVFPSAILGASVGESSGKITSVLQARPGSLGSDTNCFVKLTTSMPVLQTDFKPDVWIQTCGYVSSFIYESTFVYAKSPQIQTHLLRTASRIVEVECIPRAKQKRHLKVPELPSWVLNGLKCGSFGWKSNRLKKTRRQGGSWVSHIPCSKWKW